MRGYLGLTNMKVSSNFPMGYNDFHNIFRIYAFLPNFPFTKSKTKCSC